MISGYQIRSRHAILKLVSGTKKEEDQSFDKKTTKSHYYNLDLQFHPRREIVAEPEEESEKKSGQGKYE